MLRLLALRAPLGLSIGLGVLSACSTVALNLSPEVFYRRDIVFQVNGVKAVGVLSVPKADTYKIEGEVEGAFDYLFLRSCHREYTAEREGEHFKYTYTPRPGIEDSRACPLEVYGVERTRGRHSFGLIEFQNGRDTLRAALECNGNLDQLNGVGICQAPASLIERVLFDVPVYVASGDERCKIPEPLDLKTYEFHVPAKQCLFKFMEVAPPHRTLRLTTLGYEEVIPRAL